MPLSPPIPSLPVLFLALLGAMMVTGCGRTVQDYGRFPTPEQVEQLRPGQDTPGDVVAALGTPSHTSNLSGQSWYYISQKRDETITFRSKKIQQVVLELGFNDQGTLQSLQAYGLNDGVRVTPSRDKTATFGRNATLLEEMLGSIGKFGSQGGGVVPGL